MEPAYLIRLLREAFAQEEGELGVCVDVTEGVVRLRGTVPCERRRSRLEGVARCVCGGYEIENAIHVRAPAAPRAPEALP